MNTKRFVASLVGSFILGAGISALVLYKSNNLENQVAGSATLLDNGSEYILRASDPQTGEVNSVKVSYDSLRRPQCDRSKYTIDQCLGIMRF